MNYSVQTYTENGTAFGATYTYYDVTYTASGKPVSETWSNGATENWNYDSSTGALTETVVTGIVNPNYVETATFYGANGKATSETWLGSDGTAYQTETWNSNGSYTIDYMTSGTANGAAYTYYDVIYNASGKPVSETWSNGGAETWSYNSDTGALTETVVTGIVNSNYVETATFYGVNGNATSETWLRSGGTTYQTETWNSDGSYSIDCTASSGTAYGLTCAYYDVTYNAAGLLLSVTWLGSGGTAFQTKTWNGNGSYTIDYMTSGTAYGATYTYFDVTYNAAGKPASETWSNGAAETWNYNSAGALTETVVTGIVNPNYVETITYYGANGKATSETWLRSDETTYQSETWNSDGSYAIDYTASSGTAYGLTCAYYDVTYNAAGLLLSVTWLGSGGKTFQTETWNGNGSYTIDYMTSGTANGAAYTYYDVIYNASGKPVSETWSNGGAETWSYNSDTGALTETVVTGIVNSNYVETATFYGVNGNATSETWLRSGGTTYQTETWNSDGSYSIDCTASSGTAYGLTCAYYDVTYNAAGLLLSVTWLGSGGTAFQTKTWNGNGSYTIDYMTSGTAYGATYTYFDVTYNAAGKPASETWSNGAAETWNYNSAGALTETVVTGIVNPNYVETVTYYGANGKATSETWLRSDETTYQSETWNSDGSYAIDYTASSGTAYGLTCAYYDVTYNAAGLLLSVTWLGSGGKTFQTETWNGNGSYTIDYMTSGTAYGAPYMSFDVIYNASGKPVSQTWSNGATETWNYNSAGALTEIVVTGIVNPYYVEIATLYGANGNATSETWLGSGGKTFQAETWNGNGSYTIDYMTSGTAYGAPYTSYDVTYNASGKPVSQTWSNGATEIWNYNSAGALTETVVTGIVNPNYVEIAMLYGANGKATSETWLGSGGKTFQTETWNGNGSYAIDYMTSGTAYGAPYTSYDMTYNASGKPVSQTWSNGATEIWNYNNAGALTETVVTGIVNPNYVEIAMLYGANGKATSETWLGSGGKTFQTETWNGNGSYAIDYMTSGTAYGAPYTSYDVTYNASGKPVSQTWSNGVMEIWNYNSAGALMEAVVAGIVNPNYVEIATLYGANGKATSETWLGSGGKTFQTETWAYSPDGSYEAVTTELAGSAYSLIADIYSAANVHAAEAPNLSSSSGALQLLASGDLVAQGAGTLSVEVGADTFALSAHTNEAIATTNTHTDTFDLSSGFGQTSIAGFLEGGTTGDTLNFHLSMFELELVLAGHDDGSGGAGPAEPCDRHDQYGDLRQSGRHVDAHRGVEVNTCEQSRRNPILVRSAL